MSEGKDNQSEVARIRQQIEAENEAAKRVQDSFAYGASQHQFITRRMARMGELHDQLKAIIGETEAAKVIVEVLGKNKEGPNHV